MPAHEPAASPQRRGGRLGRMGVGHDHRAPGAEAGERFALLDRCVDGRAHDWLVVTLLTPLPLEVDPELELELALESEPVDR